MAPLLALVAAFAWGCGDFCGGIASRLANVLVALIMGQVIGFAVTLLLVLLSGEAPPKPEALVWAGLGGALGIGGLACLYLALSRGTMGLVAPLAALIGATVPALAGLLTGDDPGWLAILGMAVALAAVVVISLPDARLGRPMLPTYHGSRLREAALVLGAGLGFAAFFLAIDAAHAAGGGTWWPLFAIRVSGILLVGLATLGLVLVGRAPRLRAGPAALGIASLAAVGDLGGNLFFLLASAHGELGVVVVISSLYPVTTAVLARLILHERLSPQRTVGVVLAVVGVALISLGQVA